MKPASLDKNLDRSATSTFGTVARPVFSILRPNNSAEKGRKTASIPGIARLESLAQQVIDGLHNFYQGGEVDLGR